MGLGVGDLRHGAWDQLILGKVIVRVRVSEAARDLISARVRVGVRVGVGVGVSEAARDLIRARGRVRVGVRVRG